MRISICLFVVLFLLGLSVPHAKAEEGNVVIAWEYTSSMYRPSEKNMEYLSMYVYADKESQENLGIMWVAETLTPAPFCKTDLNNQNVEPMRLMFADKPFTLLLSCEGAHQDEYGVNYFHTLMTIKEKEYPEFVSHIKDLKRLDVGKMTIDLTGFPF